MLCKNCKYWKKIDLEEIFEDLKEDIRVCTRIEAIHDAVEHNDDYEYSIKTENKNDKAFVIDGERYLAELLTFGDFGCNQFEKKQ